VSKSSLALSIIALSLITIGIYPVNSMMENAKPVVILASLEGLYAKIPLSNVTFSITLTDESIVTSNINLGEIPLDGCIKAEAILTLPSTYLHQNLSFIIIFSDGNEKLLYGTGLLMLETMKAYWTSIYFNTSALNAESDARLTFSSIGIAGTIKVKVSTRSNVSSLITALTWRNETIVRSAEKPEMEFTFANLTSNIPEIPFELRVLANETINVLYAVGKLQVTPEKVDMPISSNQWSREYLSGWNITFIYQKYATTMELPIHVLSRGSKIISNSGSFTANFIENATAQESAKAMNQSPSLLDQVLNMLLTPTSLALIAALAVVTVITCAIKVRRRE
jgi:hypothetical protein